MNNEPQDQQATGQTPPDATDESVRTATPTREEQEVSGARLGEASNRPEADEDPRGERDLRDKDWSTPRLEDYTAEELKLAEKLHKIGLKAAFRPSQMNSYSWRKTQLHQKCGWAAVARHVLKTTAQKTFGL